MINLVFAGWAGRPLRPWRPWWPNRVFDDHGRWCPNLNFDHVAHSVRQSTVTLWLCKGARNAVWSTKAMSVAWIVTVSWSV